ncbi:MAG: Mu transposase C-terminal domain-containing protein [Pseudomonadota bacterium]|nr:Mu transposase C-terminal domain-containing protein [Pseudomonadota bacterium]
MNIHVRGAQPVLFRLSGNDRIRIGEEYYRHKATDEDHQILAPLGVFGNLREIAHAEFEQGVFSGTIEVDPGYYTLSQTNARRLGATCLVDLDAEERDLLLFRRRWVDAALRLFQEERRASRSDDGLQFTIDTILERGLALNEEENGPRFPLPSIHQLRNWIRRFLEDGDTISLRDRYCRSGWHGRRLNPLVEEVLAQIVPTYASSNRPNCKQIHRSVCAELDRRIAEAKMVVPPKMPSLRTVQRRVAALPAFDVLYGRHGRTMALRQMRPVLEGLQVSAPFERIEIDECRVNLMSLMVQARTWSTLTDKQQAEITRMRLWATVAIDCRTRTIAGVHVHAEAPSHRSALTCLHHVVVNKDPAARAAGAASPWPVYGRPVSVFTDKGSAFISGEFTAACQDLGISHLKPPAGTPQLRPRIERFFGTTASSLMCYFTGRTFANVVDKGDYKPERLASLTAAEFECALVRWICDVYHNEAHAGLGGRTPMSVWRTETRHHRIEIPPKADVQRIIFGIPVQRTLQKTGIRYMNGFYHSRHLARLLAEQRQASGREERSVEIRVNPYALSAIAVRTPDGWVTAKRTSYGTEPQRRSQPYDPETAGETFFDVQDHIRDGGGLDALEREALEHDRRARLAAHVDLVELADAARSRSGIGDPCPTEKELERDRRKIEQLFDRWERKLTAPVTDVVPEEVRSEELPDAKGRERRAAILRDRRKKAEQKAAPDERHAAEDGTEAPIVRVEAPPLAQDRPRRPESGIRRRSAADLDD